MKRVLLFYLILVFSFTAKAAIITWDGENGDGLWSTAANWVGNVVPGASDDVVLDNSSVAGSYIVTLPNTSVTVKSLRITPLAGAILFSLSYPHQII